jgi:hypothetical protein
VANEAEWIDPDTGKLMYPAERYYTASELASHTWPSCRVCGTEVTVDQAEVKYSGASKPVMYILRGWDCPNGCGKGWAERSPA